MTREEIIEERKKTFSECIKRGNRTGCGSNCGECELYERLERLQEEWKDLSED